MESKYKWYKLDNAAKVFPDTTTKSRSNMFRVAVNLKEEVDNDILAQAVKDLKDRFPTFYVKLKHGFFWYYYEYNENNLQIEEETPYMCRLPDTSINGGYMFKVMYYCSRITVEMHHSLSDGGGAMEYVKALVYRYLSLKGKAMQSDGLVITIDSRAHSLENEDSFIKNYTDDKVPPRDLEKAHRVIGTYFNDKYGFGLVNVKFKVSELKKVIGDKKQTITAYLIATLIHAIYRADFERGHGGKNPIKIFMPINMRKFYDSKTLRNFVLYIYIRLRANDKKWTFEEIIEVVQSEMTEGLDRKKLQDLLNANVKIEKNIWLKMIPLVIKKFAIKVGYNKLSSNLSTCTFSNLGDIRLPASMQEHIVDFETALPTDRQNPFNVTLCSNNDNMTVTFSRSIFQTNIEKEFVRFLSDKGLGIVVESNLWEERS